MGESGLFMESVFMLLVASPTAPGPSYAHGYTYNLSTDP